MLHLRPLVVPQKGGQLVGDGVRCIRAVRFEWLPGRGPPERNASAAGELVTRLVCARADVVPRSFMPEEWTEEWKCSVLSLAGWPDTDERSVSVWEGGGLPSSGDTGLPGNVWCLVLGVVVRCLDLLRLPVTS